jgi:hypothetical protein
MGLEDLVWIVYTHCRSLRIHDGIGNKVFANKFAALFRTSSALATQEIDARSSS